MKKIINIIPADAYESKSYKNALAYSEGDDRMLVGEVADMIDSIKKELGNVKLVDEKVFDESVSGLIPIGWINCMWCGGITYAIYRAEEVKPAESKDDDIIEIDNPEYANMSAADIKSAEKAYDDKHNDGGEGYNPCRDKLTVFHPANRIAEKRIVEGAYGFDHTQAIVDSVKHGRLLVVDGFGSTNDLEGGQYRWKHGVVAKLQYDDTFDTLDKGINDFTTAIQSVVAGQDSARPVQNWDGKTIASFAKTVGL